MDFRFIFYAIAAVALCVTCAEIGNIPSQLTVEQGQAKYRIPIPLPDRFGYGLLSELSLTYDSSAGNGIAGLGWNIEGLSSITRCRGTYAQDGKVYGVSYSLSDKFCLDGARLVSHSGTYGASGTHYLLEVDTNRRITSYGVRGSGPDSFKVEDSNLRMYYGRTADSSHFGVSQSSKYEWLLSSINDYTQAEVHFKYLTNQRYPYLSEINSGLMRIRFNYEKRPDVRTMYHNGQILKQMTLRLKSIQTIINNKVHRDLTFQYTFARALKTSLLEKMTLCNGAKKCWKPTTITYKGMKDVKTLASPSYWVNEFGISVGGWAVTHHPRFVVDVTGDGLSDVVGFANGGVYVAVNSGNKKFHRGKYWLNSFGYTAGGWRVERHPRFVVDVNGDALPDIVGFANSGVFVSLNTNGESFGPSRMWVAGFGYSSGWRINSHPRFVKDVNGDGLADIVGFASDGVYVSINTGNSFKPHTLWLSKQFAYVNGWRVNRHPRYLEDVNGDGLPDIVGFANSGVYVALNTGTSFTSHSLWLAAFGYTAGGWRVERHPRFVTDVNGDGLADIVGFSCCGVEVSLSTGKSFLTSRTWTTSFGQSTGGWSVSQHPRFLEDMNGDGLIDVVGFASGGVYVGLNTGSSFESSSYWIAAFGATSGGWSTSTHPRMLVDVTGDGVKDVVGFANGGVYIAVNQNHLTAMTQAVDAFGNKDTVRYSTQADKHVYISAKRANTYPNVILNTAQQLVKEIGVSDGIGGQNRTTFRYGSLHANLQGRGILGLEWIEATQSHNNEMNKDEFNYIFPLTGSVKKSSRIINGKAVLIKNQDFISRQSPAERLVKQVILKQTGEKTFELNGKLIKEVKEEYNKIDIFGKALEVVKTVKGGGKTFVQSTSKSIKHDKVNWFIGQITSIAVTHLDDRGKRMTRRTDYQYDTVTRKLISDTIEPSNPLALKSVYNYDRFGNLVAQIRKSGQGSSSMQERKVTMTYDSLGVRKLSTSNGFGHQETYSYDSFGNLLVLKGANGLNTRWTYDSFDRKLSEIRPDNTKITWSYSWENSLPNAAYKVTKMETAKPTEIKIYDTSERVIRVITKVFQDDTVYEDIKYDKMSHIEQQSLPYKVAQALKWIKYSYDQLGRETKIEKPMNNQQRTISSKVYSGLVRESFDTKGRKTVMEYDAMGRPIKVTDAGGGQVSYYYDAIGNLIRTTDPAGNAHTFEYDAVGNKIQVSDPDMGIWTYKYNVFGEMIYQNDAKGQVKTEEYDILGRIIKRQEVEGISEWKYDTATNGKGKIASIKGSQGFERHFQYDKFGRESEVKTVIQSNTFTVKTFYNRQGKISMQSYPGNKNIYYCYSDGGYLVSVRKSACGGKDYDFYWKGLTYDASGRITVEKFGNSLKTNYEYDYLGHVTKIYSSDAKNKKIRHWQYEYDAHGSMVTRKDFSPDRNMIESFAYDQLDRIIRATLKDADPRKQMAITEDWQYDKIGNIRRYSGLGGVHHQYHPQKPRALIRAGPNTYDYDANGNVIRRNEHQIQWTSSNMPHTFKGKIGQTVSFKYGPDNERFLKTVGNSERTFYIGKVYERVDKSQTNAMHKYFIYANGKLVAIELKQAQSTSSSLKYVHRDHLGSIDTVTDASGVVLERLRYSVFGRRQPLSWSEYSKWMSYSQPRPDQTVRGFTGHEHIEELDLIHMNGRVYDPVVGRFLSPDPHVQDPYDTQSFNRYSYVRNNPLRHNDPSGYFFKKIGKFFKKILKPKVILAVVASVVTFGAATPWAAGLAAGAGLTGTTAAVATGAIAGAASGFVGGTVITGSIKGGFQGALGGAITGGIGGYFGSGWTVERVAAQSAGSGLANELTGGKFRDGLILGAVASSMRYVYNKMVKYDVSWEPGGKAVGKQPWDMPSKGANNIGTAETTLDPSGWFNEGGRVSSFLNRVPGINAVAGLHDVFQVRLDQVAIPFARDIFNVPGMLPAAAMTYSALLDGPTSAALIVDQKRSRRVQ